MFEQAIWDGFVCMDVTQHVMGAHGSVVCTICVGYLHGMGDLNISHDLCTKLLYRDMDLSITERSIVKLFFHPRIIRQLDKYFASTLRKSSHRRIEFACTHPNSLRQRMCTNGHAKMFQWMRDNNLHVVTGNCGVVDMDDARVLALDMILAHPPGHAINADDPQLTMCTVVLNARASPTDIRRAHDHTREIHSLVNNIYLIRCRSVLLTWGVDKTFSEVWFTQ